MAEFAVVERQALAHLTGGIAHHGIRVGVVGGRPVEDLDAEGPLFQLIGLSGECLLHDVLEQGWIALAVAEVGTRKDFVQFGQDRITVLTGLRMPCIPDLVRSTHLLLILESYAPACLPARTFVTSCNNSISSTFKDRYSA